MLITDKNINTNPVQFSSEQASFIVSKNQRLSSALYMVTNLMPDTEPLKWKLREMSLILLSDINNFFGTPGQKANLVTDKIVADLESILSYISVALSDNNVSQMNFTILRQEYESLKNTILAGTNTEIFSAYVLSGINVSTNALPSAGNNQIIETTVRAEDKPRSNTVISKPTPSPVSKPINVSLDAGDKGGRKDQIKQFLKGQSWTSIKDISRSISGCSVKTVQRDLVDLVNSGVLEKIGERRWSRYRLLGQ